MALKIVSGIDVTSISLSSFLDLAKNELRNAQIHNLTTTQIASISSPATGQFVYDTTLSVLKVYDGTSWNIVGADVDDTTIELSSNTLSIKAGGVGATQLATGAVTTVKIAADAVTGAKIADDQINSEHYVDGSIDTAHLADDAVTNAKIGAGAVGTTEIADGSVSTGKLQDRGVTYAKIQQVSATSRILGRITTGAGDIEELTAANVRTMINVADGATANTGTVTSVAATAAGGINISGSPITTSGTLTIGTTGNLQDLHQLGAVDAADKFIVSSAAGTFAYEDASTVRGTLGLGTLATLDAVGAAQITDNTVGAAELNVSGNGTAGQVLKSDGDGTFTWVDQDVTEANLKAVLAGLDSLDTLYIGDSGNDTEVVIRGNLTVDGTTTTVNSNTLEIGDNKIVLNGDLASDTAPTEDAGIVVNRGNATDAELFWDESAGRWTMFDGSTNYTIPTQDTNTQLSNEQVQDIVGGMVTGNTESNISVTYQDADGTLDFSVPAATSSAIGAARVAAGAGMGVSVSGGVFTVSTSVGVYTNTSVSVTGGTASILKTAHGIGYPANVQVYDSNGQLVLADVRQTTSGDNNITINAANGTYAVVITGQTA
jgi:hypothetical protein